jgi:hypothetical protein
MKQLSIMLLALLATACSPKSAKEENKVVEVRDEAPYFVAVRENRNGEVQYLDIDHKMSEDQVLDVVTHREQDWQRVGYDQRISNAYPQSAQSKSIYFVENPADLQNSANSSDLSGEQGYHGGRRCGRYNSGYHIYYGYNSYRHCYPDYNNYHGYYYQPTFYWRQNYYYYQPVYQPYAYGNWYYYVYRAGWWW